LHSFEKILARNGRAFDVCNEILLSNLKSDLEQNIREREGEESERKEVRKRNNAHKNNGLMTSSLPPRSTLHTLEED
jgi:hypothetical protein